MLLKDFAEIINYLAPPDLAADWDNCGLQVGSPESPVTKIGLALDATEGTVAVALKAGCDLLLSHHPLLFRAVKNIDFQRPPGSVIAAAISGGLSIYSAHSNWDSAENGVAPALAELLELTGLRPLAPALRDFDKLAVCVPAGYENRLRRALFQIGAGVVGDYDHCWFGLSGEGGFRVPKEASPFIGQRGRETITRESRLEFILPRALAPQAAEALRAVHPYEEPAFEFYPVRVSGQGQGLGLVGHWNPPRNLLALLEGLGLAFKWSGPRPERVGRVALLPGSGGSCLPAAKAAGAEVLITGDAAYHQALEAESLGLTLVDLGHHETEWPGVLRLARLLKAEFLRRRLDLECLTLKQNCPWTYHRGPAEVRSE
ncbi:MAG: Nif3-like dinuclear metal center hexameric protein [Candidatus Adiutrix sp.]|jgi:dinuclear metal center YbgI/SA1388 family protein|nr:Nif3-like dinuclear metal center hexameric protein [Candidatus Adiutrix sp.]